MSGARILTDIFPSGAATPCPPCPPGTGAWTTQLDLDFTNVTNAGPFTSGTNTLTIGADTIDVTTTRFGAGANGALTATNGTGLVYTGTAGTFTVALDFISELAAWTRAELASYKYAVHIVIDSVAFTSTGDSLIGGVSTNTTHNSGDSRVFFADVDGVGPITERWRTRNNTSNSSDILSGQATKTQRVITSIIGDGAIIEVMDSNGLTPPTPAPGGANTYMVGGDAVGLLDITPQYLSCYSVTNFGVGANGVITRILVQKYV